MTQNKKRSTPISPKISLKQMSLTALPFLTPTFHSRAANIFFPFSPMSTHRRKIIMK